MQTNKLPKNSVAGFTRQIQRDDRHQRDMSITDPVKGKHLATSVGNARRYSCVPRKDLKRYECPGHCTRGFALKNNLAPEIVGRCELKSRGNPGTEKAGTLGALTTPHQLGGGGPHMRAERLTRTYRDSVALVPSVGRDCVRGSCNDDLAS